MSKKSQEAKLIEQSKEDVPPTPEEEVERLKEMYNDNSHDAD